MCICLHLWVYHPYMCIPTPTHYVSLYINSIFTYTPIYSHTYTSLSPYMSTKDKEVWAQLVYRWVFLEKKFPFICLESRCSAQIQPKAKRRTALAYCLHKKAWQLLRIGQENHSNPSPPGFTEGPHMLLCTLIWCTCWMSICTHIPICFVSF